VRSPGLVLTGRGKQRGPTAGHSVPEDSLQRRQQELEAGEMEQCLGEKQKREVRSEARVFHAHSLLTGPVHTECKARWIHGASPGPALFPRTQFCKVSFSSESWRPLSLVLEGGKVPQLGEARGLMGG
jgi:hypothetical protein